jgi:hypothetical protein
MKSARTEYLPVESVQVLASPAAATVAHINNQGNVKMRLFMTHSSLFAVK